MKPAYDIIILKSRLAHAKTSLKNAEEELSIVQQDIRNAGFWWLLKKKFDFSDITCYNCWSGINQDSSKCSLCPSYNLRVKLTLTDISKINDKFISASH